MSTIRVTIPATTANLGPGFDCLGLALGLYNEVTLSNAAAGLTILVEGEGKGKLPEDESNLVARAAALLFRQAEKHPPGLVIRQRNNIPVGSGLGSSAAATLGGIMAANALIGANLPRTDLLRLAVTMERHPDNVAAALFGGLALVIQDGESLEVEQIEVPSMQVVVVLPQVELATATARAALPDQVPMADAVYNIGRTALLVRALERGDMRNLGLAMKDRLHQDYRLPLIPGMKEAFAAALEAGAAAVALSGAGPSVAAFAAGDHELIGRAMLDAFAEYGLKGRMWLLPVDTLGAQLNRLS